MFMYWKAIIIDHEGKILVGGFTHWLECSWGVGSSWGEAGSWAWPGHLLLWLYFSLFLFASWPLWYEHLCHCCALQAWCPASEPEDYGLKMRTCPPFSCGCQILYPSHEKVTKTITNMHYPKTRTKLDSPWMWFFTGVLCVEILVSNRGAVRRWGDL